MKRDAKRAGMTFALLSSASLLAAVNPPAAIDEARSETQDRPRESKPEDYPAWDAQIEMELGDADQLLKGYDGSGFDSVESQHDSPSVALDERPSEVPTLLNPPSEEAELGGIYSVDEGYESELDTYYRILGSLMYQGEPEGENR